MRDLVAVNHYFTALSMPTLKQEALMFSRIAIPSLSVMFSIIETLTGERPLIFSEYDWLCEQGIIFETNRSGNSKIANNEYKQVNRTGKKYGKAMERIIAAHGLKEFAELRKAEVPEFLGNAKGYFKEKVSELTGLVESPDFLENMVLAYDYYIRSVSIELRELDNLDTYPVLLSGIPNKQKASSSKNDVLQITLNALPVPDANTPWEHILEYRSDPDSQSKFLALRNWMSDVSRTDLTPIEIEQKLEYLVDQYRRHIELHKMKVNSGVLETVVITTAEFLENLVTIKLGKLAKSLFAFKQRKVSLLEGELTAPGNQVAYVVKANDTFVQ